MTNIVLFPSALGVRQGVHDAADLLREAGHDGWVFDAYDDAGKYEEAVGYPALMEC